jgi:hypothetical protein
LWEILRERAGQSGTSIDDAAGRLSSRRVLFALSRNLAMPARTGRYARVTDGNLTIGRLVPGGAGMGAETTRELVAYEWSSRGIG